ncbi:DUF1997 domain-containing protein [Skeletonema marinoi]|uniref:DUF1997 domain-containing protein n=1 Tax=Skeletonema marinoi TaxID=267567 RepID=A0AAD8YA53_9STRA|nr:DUF1997 domain-containing protein [Skeletonema marinoi]
MRRTSSFRHQIFHLLMAMTFTTLSLTTILLLPSSTLGFSAVTPPRIKDTKVSVEGMSTAPVIPPPLQSSSDCDGSNVDVVSLSNYMRLPVEQYVLIEMPLGSSLTKIDNNEVYKGEEFELVVPEITFFNLTLQPVVLCTVQPMEDRVVIFSDNCYLRGSSFIEKTRLNERFDFRVSCTLTWNDEQNLVAADVQSGEDESDTEDTGRKNKFRFRNKENSELDDETDCSITSSTITAITSIDVAVDVPRPFSSIPKFIVERTGNAAMKLSLKYIQANFVRNLANDYEKWSTDEEYRSYRASLLSKEEEVECVAESQSLV